MITVTCETDVDSYAEAYYSPVVSCTLKDGAGNNLASGQQTGFEETSEIDVTFEYQGQPGTAYVLYGAHELVYQTTDDQDEGDGYSGGYNTESFLDYYDFQQPTLQYDYYGNLLPPNGSNIPFDFGFEGPGPLESSPSEVVFLSNTEQGAGIPPNIAIRFSGAKSPGDNLALSSFSCSTALGLKACGNGWNWNLEGVAPVGDDASMWTLSVQVLSGSSISGNTKDSSGNLHPYSQSIPAQPDGPEQNELQQTKGTKTIFYLDGPGPNTQAGGLPVDSVTFGANFNVSVCSTVVQSVCANQNYFTKVVVNPGASLSTTSSAAGLGSLP